jgi:hypothetical protein
MTDYRQTVEEAAGMLEICAAGGSPGATRLLPLADALRSGLAPALERAREEERERLRPLIEDVATALYLAPASFHERVEEKRVLAARQHMAALIRAIRTPTALPAPPPPATETPPAFAPLIGCESSVLVTATAPEREPAADAEPFCACGRRTSECDGSRAGCRTQCREEEAP